MPKCLRETNKVKEMSYKNLVIISCIAIITGLSGCGQADTASNDNAGNESGSSEQTTTVSTETTTETSEATEPEKDEAPAEAPETSSNRKKKKQ